MNIVVLRYVNFYLVVNVFLYGIYCFFCSLVEGIIIVVVVREVLDGLVDIWFGIVLGGAVVYYLINVFCF